MKFYRAKGLLREKLLAMHRKRLAQQEVMREFSRKHGAKSIGIRETIGIEFVLIFGKDKADMNAWRLCKGTSDQYIPRRSSKLGLEAEAEMAAICRATPSLGKIGEMIGMKSMHVEDGQMKFGTPGFAVYGEDSHTVLLGVRDSYKVPNFLGEQMQRISDIEYECALKTEKAREKAQKSEKKKQASRA